MTKKRIFVVDDDENLAEMLCTYLETQDYDVAAAHVGEEAVARIIADPPDVAVLDIRLPDIDGYEICRRLRQSRRTRDLPIIFLTDRRERENRLAGLELGAVDYMTKPFDIQELRLRIRNALRRADSHTLHNPVTGLPEGALVQERLERLLEEPEWGLVLASLHGLDAFRDRYGFVAADDVTRAVSLMIHNAVQEDEEGADDFIGHSDSDAFLIVTDRQRCRKLAERCRARLKPSIPYFYPAHDRERARDLPPAERLSVDVAALASSDGAYGSVADLGAAFDDLMRS